MERENILYLLKRTSIQNIWFWNDSTLLWDCKIYLTLKWAPFGCSKIKQLLGMLKIVLSNKLLHDVKILFKGGEVHLVCGASDMQTPVKAINPLRTFCRSNYNGTSIFIYKWCKFLQFSRYLWIADTPFPCNPLYRGSNVIRLSSY